MSRSPSYVITRSSDKLLIKEKAPGQYLIHFGRLLRDRLWTSHGGAAQNIFDNDNLASLQLNLSQVTWADPLPLLALSCDLNNLFITKPDLQVEIDLGVPRIGFDNRFLRYVADHGFLRFLAPNAVFFWKSKKWLLRDLKYLEAELRSLEVTLAYENTNCINATVFDSQQLSHDDISSIIDRLMIEGQETRINRWLSKDLAA